VKFADHDFSPFLFNVALVLLGSSFMVSTNLQFFYFFQRAPPFIFSVAYMKAIAVPFSLIKSNIFIIQ